MNPWMYAAACTSIAGHIFKINKSDCFTCKVRFYKKNKRKLNRWMYAAASTSIAGHTFKIHSSDYLKLKSIK